jgi:hypothetical protein
MGCSQSRREFGLIRVNTVETTNETSFIKVPTPRQDQLPLPIGTQLHFPSLVAASFSGSRGALFPPVARRQAGQ